MTKLHGSTIMGIFLISILFLSGSLHCFANFTVDIAEFEAELSKRFSDSNRVSLVKWFPLEYWEVNLRNNPSITPSQIDSILQVLNPYTIIAVLDGKIGPFGGINFSTKEELQATIKIYSSGTYRSPYLLEELSPDLRSLVATLGAYFADVIGTAGENLHLFIFPAVDTTGTRLVNPSKPGSFSVFLDEEEFRWRLPLGSLSPAKYCSACGEKLSGSYLYCPYDSTKLIQD